MFKRRNKKTYWETTVESVYPRKGWRRGLDYMSHRIKRLPDTPHKIAMGIACGVFVTFTPFFGLHFFLAWFFAVIFRGNVFAAILATFVGNPLTFPIIAATSYKLGLWILGLGHKRTVWAKLRDSFQDAFGTLWGTIKSLFGYEKHSWDGFLEFIQEVFLPYLVGGIIPGIVTAVIFYVFSKPLIAGYQKRRKLKIAKRIALRAAEREET